MTEQLPNSPLRVRMTHPTLDDEIAVDPLAVPHHEYAGWQVVPGQDVEGDQWPADLQRFEGQQQVRMHHPDIADDIIVGESAVPFHRSKGWLVSDDEAAQALDSRTVEELREEAKARGISPLPTKKAELIEALAAGTEQDTKNQDQAGEQPAPTEEG